MTNIELLTLVKNDAVQYSKDGITASLKRNKHLTRYDGTIEPEIFAKQVLVDFINAIGAYQCIDYAMNIEDFEKELSKKKKKSKKIKLKPDNVINLKL